MQGDDADLARVRVVIAELRAAELVMVLRHAVADEPYWRIEAQCLLELIDGGVPPRPKPAADREAA